MQYSECIFAIDPEVDVAHKNSRELRAGIKTTNRIAGFVSRCGVSEQYMKINYFSSSIFPSSKANSVHVMKMCAALSRNGYDVALFAASHADCTSERQWLNGYGVSEGDFHIVLIANCTIPRLGRVVYGYKVARKARMDSVVNYGRCPHSLYFSLRHGVPFVYEAHAIPSGYARRKLEERLFNAEKFVKLVVISEALKRQYLGLYGGLLEGKVTVAHDGADLVEEMPDDAYFHRSVVNGFRVGYVGSLYPGRGIDIVLKLAASRPEYEFHIVGGTSEEVAYWSGRAPGNTRFKGHVEPRNVIGEMRSVDVLLMPYQQSVSTVDYMSPMKMFEYMSTGRPIISSDFPVIREILAHDYNAALVASDSLGEWLDSIDKMFGDSVYCKMLAKNAYADLASKYTWNKRVSKILGTIET